VDRPRITYAPDPARREGIDVRAPDGRPIRAQVHVEIVGDDEEDVEPVRRRLAAERRRQTEHDRGDADDQSFHSRNLRA
jgi:hypothetical protein